MPGRRPNHRRVKANRNFTVEELATLLEVNRQTVREWVKRGLAIIDDKRPMLVHGSDVIAFLLQRRTKNKQPCRPGEMYCVRCRSTRHAAYDLADYYPQTALFGNLTGICPVCEGLIHRSVSLAKLEQIRGTLVVTMRPAERGISGSACPTVNLSFEEGRTDGKKIQR